LPTSRELLENQLPLKPKERPGSSGLDGENRYKFPFEAFGSDNPNDTETPRIRLQSPWRFEVSEGVVYLSERSSAPDVETDEGVIYTIDNKLYFKSSDGTEHEIAFV